MEVTSIEKWKSASAGNLVSIPGFADKEPMVVRLRKPNMLMLIKSGKINNALLASAMELFDGKQKGNENKHTLEQLAEFCDLMACMCDASMVEPKYKDLTDNGIELTMEQMATIFNYTQGGVSDLEPFRKEQGDNAGGECSTSVECASKQSVRNR